MAGALCRGLFTPPVTGGRAIAVPLRCHCGAIAGVRVEAYARCGGSYSSAIHQHARRVT